MPIDRITLAKLRKFAKVFADARDRDANQSDTVMRPKRGRSMIMRNFVLTLLLTPF